MKSFILSSRLHHIPSCRSAYSPASSDAWLGCSGEFSISTLCYSNVYTPWRQFQLLPFAPAFGSHLAISCFMSHDFCWRQDMLPNELLQLWVLISPSMSRHSCWASVDSLNLHCSVCRKHFDQIQLFQLIRLLTSVTNVFPGETSPSSSCSNIYCSAEKQTPLIMMMKICIIGHHLCQRMVRIFAHTYIIVRVFSTETHRSLETTV